jgi:3-oxoacyl-[acyl-carrier protein] reductase
VPYGNEWPKQYTIGVCGQPEASCLDGSEASQMVANTPLGRVGQPGDIAPAVVFLASDESAWITGESIKVSGGLN